jgi:hypothetical protein
MLSLMSSTSGELLSVITTRCQPGSSAQASPERPCPAPSSRMLPPRAARARKQGSFAIRGSETTAAGQTAAPITRSSDESGGSTSRLRWRKTISVGGDPGTKNVEIRPDDPYLPTGPALSLTEPACEPSTSGASCSDAVSHPCRSIPGVSAVRDQSRTRNPTRRMNISSPGALMWPPRPHSSLRHRSVEFPVLFRISKPARL